MILISIWGFSYARPHGQSFLIVSQNFSSLLSFSESDP